MAKRASSKKKEDSELLKALKFVSIAQKDIGSTGEMHCAIFQGQVIAFDGVIAAGYPCGEEIQCFPQTKRLIDALEKVKNVMSMSLLASNQLAIKDGDRFTAYIPTVSGAEMPFAAPDPKNWPLNDHFKNAAKLAGVYTTEGAQTVVGSSILSTEYTFVGTNTLAVIEVMHKNHIPPGLILPKRFFDHLNKIEIPIVGFGYAENTFTAHFENGAWVRTQLYKEQWPNVYALLDRGANMTKTPITAKLAEAVETVASFSTDSRVYVGDNRVSSHREENIGASFTCPGAGGPVIFNARSFLTIAPYVANISFGGETDNVISWEGEVDEFKVRGILAKYT